MSWYDPFVDAYDATLGEKGLDITGSGARKAGDAAVTGLKTEVVPGFQNLATDMWGKAQEGLGYAQDQTLDAQYAADQYAQYGQQQGLQQNIFEMLGPQMYKPGDTQGVYDAAQAALGGQSKTQGYGGAAMGTLGRDTQRAGDLYGQYMGQLGDQTQLQGAWGNLAAGLGQAGAGEQYYQGQQGALAGPGGYEQAAGGYAAGMTGPDAMRGLYAQMQGQGQTGAQQAWQGAQGTLGGGMAEQMRVMNAARGVPGAVDIGAGEIGDAYRGANNVQGFAGRQQGNLEGPGLYEQQAAAAFSGNDPLQDRVGARGRAAINQEAIARGHYDSGGAMNALGNYQAELDAQLYQKKLDLAKGAGQAQIARLGAGQGLAAGAAGERMNQGQALQGLANNQRLLELQERGFNVNAAQGNAGIGLQGGQGADQAMQARQNAMLNAAGGIDQGGLAAQRAQAETMQNAQQMQLARMGLGGQLAGDAQQQMLARYGMQMQGLQGMDAQTLARYGLAGQMGAQADQTGLARAQQQFQIGQGMDQATIDRLMAQGQLGNMADQNQLARMGLMLDAAGNITQRGDTLQQNNVENQQALANLQAGLGLNFTQIGMQQYGDAQAAGLNALANAYGVQTQNAQANAARGPAWLDAAIPG